MSRVRLCARYGWTLLRSRKNDLPVSNFASPWFKVEGSDAVDDHRGSAAVPVHEHIAFGCDLGHEDMAFMAAALTIGDMVDQEDASFRINFHFAVAEIGDLNGDLTATGAFHDLVYDLLGESVEHD